MHRSRDLLRQRGSYPTRAEELRVLAIELLIGIQQSEVRGLHLEGSTLEEAQALDEWRRQRIGQ